jgi:chemotaxis response regulator CheB
MVHMQCRLTHEQVYLLERQHLVARIAHHLAVLGAVAEVARLQHRAAARGLAREAARQAEAAAGGAVASGTGTTAAAAAYRQLCRRCSTGTVTLPTAAVVTGAGLRACMLFAVRSTC